MRRSVLLLFVPLLLLAGCKNRESQLVGKWSGNGQSVNIQADKSWTVEGASIPVGGKWSFADPKLTLTVDQASISKIKDLARQQIKANPVAIAMAGGEKKIMAQLDKLGEPQVATLSEDGKTLVVSSATNGKTATLTKEASK